VIYSLMPVQDGTQSLLRRFSDPFLSNLEKPVNRFVCRSWLKSSKKMLQIMPLWSQARLMRASYLLHFGRLTKWLRKALHYPQVQEDL
jgi:hypothetical protein